MGGLCGQQGFGRPAEFGVHRKYYHNIIQLSRASAVCSSIFGFRATRYLPNMQVIVKSLDSTFVVSVPEGARVADLRAAIEDVEFIPAGKL